MLVKQEIPDGDFCTNLTDSREGYTPETCVFFGTSPFHNENNPILRCTRHPDVGLATEEINDKICVIKCRACMNETKQGMPEQKV